MTVSVLILIRDCVFALAAANMLLTLLRYRLLRLAVMEAVVYVLGIALVFYIGNPLRSGTALTALNWLLIVLLAVLSGKLPFSL